MIKRFLDGVGFDLLERENNEVSTISIKEKTLRIF